ncbi:MAG: hypothetical protein M9944_02710 [Rhizobiaceae bacterium]|nr:hypothetical protein [Rhizobiaceae bacterium]
MADFVAVLKKTLDGLGETTPEMRARVYEKARSTVAAKLSAISPAPPAAVIQRQKKALEDAISSVESEYVKIAPSSDDPLDELESVFAALKEAKPIGADKKSAAQAPVPVPASAPKPVPAATPKPAPAKASVSPEASKNIAPPPPPSIPFPDARTVAAKPVPSTGPLENTLPPQPFSFDDDEQDAFDDRDNSDREFSDRVRPTYSDRVPNRRKLVGLLAAVLAILVVGGGAYGIWLNKDEFGRMLGMGESDPVAVSEQPAETPPSTDVASANPEAQPEEPASAASAPKFTQRLNADGTEVDEGPAGGEQTFGEGTSVAAITTPVASDQPPTLPPATQEAPPAGDAAAAQDPAQAPVEGAPAVAADGAPSEAASGEPAQVMVGQRAIFYEERTSTAQGSAEPGSIVWSQVQESPGGDMPPEPAIRAEATIPGKDIQLRMTIRRNGDKTLPASHIIEMIFLTPEGFEGGGIDSVLRVALKDSEQDAGNPLLGIPAKIADGFFLFALNDSKNEIDANLNLLRKQNWIDIPIVYKNGRRALITMEKGVPGEKVFNDAIAAWQSSTAG